MRLFVGYILILSLLLLGCKELKIEQIQRCDDSHCVLTTYIIDDGGYEIYYDNEVSIDQDMLTEILAAEWRKAQSVIDSYKKRKGDNHGK